jgi:hypothetical protein
MSGPPGGPLGDSSTAKMPPPWALPVSPVASPVLPLTVALTTSWAGRYAPRFVERPTVFLDSCSGPLQLSGIVAALAHRGPQSGAESHSFEWVTR